MKVLRERDVAWAIADCDLVLTYPDTVEYKPHRVICIFQRVDGRWRWRLFSSTAMPSEMPSEAPATGNRDTADETARLSA